MLHTRLKNDRKRQLMRVRSIQIGIANDSRCEIHRTNYIACKRQSRILIGCRIFTPFVMFRSSHCFRCRHMRPCANFSARFCGTMKVHQHMQLTSFFRNQLVSGHTHLRIVHHKIDLNASHAPGRPSGQFLIHFLLCINSIYISPYYNAHVFIGSLRAKLLDPGIIPTGIHGYKIPTVFRREVHVISLAFKPLRRPLFRPPRPSRFSGLDPTGIRHGCRRIEISH